MISLIDFLLFLVFLLILYTAIELGKKNFVIILLVKYCDDAKSSKLILCGPNIYCCTPYYQQVPSDYRNKQDYKIIDYDNIEITGLNQFKAFNYDVPGDISSASFFIVLTLLSKKSELLIKKVNVNKSRLGIIKILNMMNAKIKLQNK